MWDQRERRLTLARDRFGEKPLYYGWLGVGVDRTFVFGSELKALRAHPSFVNRVSRDALALYLQHCAVPAPYSIYEDVFKLPPASLLALEADDFVHEGLRIEPYWSLGDTARLGLANPIHSDSEAIACLDNALGNAVSQQSVADVPLGAFLSGGVDSTTIVALMQARSNRRVQTFTVGFDEAGFDEAPHAFKVARHIGTDHHELRVTSADALSVIPNLPIFYDEPFADSSQIPTHLDMPSGAAARDGSACLGDAGDELFGGYNRYILVERAWKWLGLLPGALRRSLGAGIHRLPVSSLDFLGRACLGSRKGVGLGEKAHKLALRLQTVGSSDELYRSLVNEWPRALQLVRGARQCPTRLEDPLTGSLFIREE